MSAERYDYIISGAGCAGLSLLIRMIHSGKFRDKRILLADREFKTRNDRTWCFWEKHEGLFEPIVFRKWSELNFFGEQYETLLTIDPYSYKMIRGEDFYGHCLGIIKNAPNVTLVEGNIEETGSTDKSAFVTIGGSRYEGSYLFNSVLFEKPTNKGAWYFLQQHFKGWVIKTNRSVFDPRKATLMDFRPSQQHGATFVYVLPFSDNTALVEYTLFTKDLLKPDEYDAALRDYVSNYITTKAYSIQEEEFGVIPMTNFPFRPFKGRVVNIGTAGGQTKPSSGYTFQFIQKYTSNIVDALITSGDPLLAQHPSAKRFSFYDSTLLQVLDRKTIEGKKLFTDLFRHGDVQTVLKFLDNETSLREDLDIMRRLPKGKFAAAALREVFKVK